MILEDSKEIINKETYSVMIVDKYQITDNHERIDLGFEGTVWSQNGGTVILNLVFKNKKKFEKAKKKAIENWQKGIISCDDCGKKCKYEKIKNNRYFAGVYCNKCWNSKWKKIEAEEDYN